MQVLDFTKLKGTEYLKAVRWFEYRTGTCFFIEDNKLKKSKSNTLLDENYQMFGEFLKTYKGALPEIKSQKAEIEEDYIEKYKKYSKEPRDEFDLIENTSMKIGGRTVFGGYGTGKNAKNYGNNSFMSTSSAVAISYSFSTVRFTSPRSMRPI